MKNQKIIVEKTQALLAIRAYQPMKDAGQAWLDAIGTDGEKEAAEKFIFEMEDAIASVDHLIEFFSSDMAIEKFGAEKAAQIKQHGEDLKASGQKWCDCPACTAALAVLNYKEDMLA